MFDENSSRFVYLALDLARSAPMVVAGATVGGRDEGKSSERVEW